MDEPGSARRRRIARKSGALREALPRLTLAARPRPEGLLSAPGHRLVAPSISVFAHVVQVRSVYCAVSGAGPGRTPLVPAEWLGLPDSSGKAGRTGRENEGQQEGLGRSEVTPGVRGRRRLAAGGAGAPSPGGLGTERGVPCKSRICREGRGFQGPSRPGRCMGLPSLRAAAGALRKACGAWIPRPGPYRFW